ncbi:MAG TPA: hypothetical protein VK550_16065 [Polyangiaceae bacterium]|nr:hypothetical protein [Polyangiaceae bacterium]
MSKLTSFSEHNAKRFYERLGKNIHDNPDCDVRTRVRHFSTGAALYTAVLERSALKRFKNYIRGFVKRFSSAS